MFRNLFFVFILFFSVSLLANSGKDIFDRFCIACHSPAMSPLFGSPAVHDVSAWNERKELALKRANINLKNVTESQKLDLSLQELVKSAINGTDKGMPPRGTCFECTDDDLKSVISFMSSSE